MAGPSDEELDEVYLGDFEGFVSRRDALAKRLKADGEGRGGRRGQGAQEAQPPAWAVNQFAAHGKKLRTEMLKAGTALRDSQEGLVSGGAGP